MIEYPKHNHPHGIENTPPDNARIWICEECNHIFSDAEIRADLPKHWGHDCKQHPCRKGQRCESHLEPYMPDMPSVKKNRGRKCRCGHWEDEHNKYINEGINRHGSRFVCTKDGCYGWKDCNL